jgi:hypothetical protein
VCFECDSLTRRLEKEKKVEGLGSGCGRKSLAAASTFSSEQITGILIGRCGSRDVILNFEIEVVKELPRKLKDS